MKFATRHSITNSPYEMTDYAEEQRNELEALQSIYPDEFEREPGQSTQLTHLITFTEISDTEFRIHIEPDDQDPTEPCILALHVTYTPNYPDELPIIEIEQETASMESIYYDKLAAEVTRVAEDSIGMVMTFTLASLLKENLTQMIIDRRTAREEADAERVRQEIEGRPEPRDHGTRHRDRTTHLRVLFTATRVQAEEAKFRGTRVSAQIFMEWKARFDKEMTEKELAEKGRVKDIKGKLTGRQLFETDKSLVQSDVNLIEEGDVAVDISLFEREENFESDSDDEENAVWRNFGDDD
ncbi:ubiquitin-conjugating enzyme/RWD-like protein [Jimgerdemannia flammicorona]|uniref:Ubiquitin-conjugating enzyme/RWD-like protein n=1 Tax=Jimgerdemannia flammicorona TaxID=994334 RepID=A0A433QIA1_9FUNG|nr:ubiquitin-conjugating enzyme/RWD-like protein [Jimgerdemannia flammicorona]